MPLVSRRRFVTGLTASAALGGFLGELRPPDAFARDRRSATARILFNENPLGPSPKAVAAVEGGMDTLSRYPLGLGPQLVSGLRKRHGLAYDEAGGGLSLVPAAQPAGGPQLALGVGSSEILKAAASAYCSGGGNVVEPYPSYAAVGAAAQRIPGANVERRMVPLDAEQRLDVRAMCEAIDDATRIVVVCNPNNPTGTAITTAEIESIIDAAPPGALVLVDEAYIEFVDDDSTTTAVPFTEAHDNVLVARTFSKIFGLAGLRIGYGIGAAGVIERIEPYLLGSLSLNMPGALGALAALDDEAHLKRTRELTRATQAAWRRAFHDVGWSMTPTKTCFCWVDVGTDCGPLVAFLAERGVLVSGGQRWDLPHFVRISTGTEEETDRLIAGVRAFANA